MPSRKAATIGLSITALSAIALMGFSLHVGVGSARNGNGNHRMSMSERVHLCLEDRRSGGYDDRDTTREERRELRMQFRMCIRQALDAHHGGNHSASATSAATSAMTSASASSAMSAQVQHVAIQGFAYSPSTITVRRGTTVVWMNHDSAPHTVTSGAGGPLSSGTLQQNDAYSYTFNTTGTFTYSCTFHPSMQGTVIVTN